MKTKKLSRWLSVLLALTMVVGMLPTAWADGEDIKIEGLNSTITLDAGKDKELSLSVSGSNLTVDKWSVSSSSTPGISASITNEGKLTITATKDVADNASATFSVTANYTIADPTPPETNPPVTPSPEQPTPGESSEVPDSSSPVPPETSGSSGENNPENGENTSKTSSIPEPAKSPAAPKSNESVPKLTRESRTGTISKEFTVTVKNNKPDVTPSVTLNSTSIVLKVNGGTRTLTATTTPAGQSIEWSSKNPSIATVEKSTGVVTPVASGDAVIVAKMTYGGKDYTAECAVRVNNPDIIAVTSVTLDKSSLSLTVGGSQTLKATIIPNDATTTTVKWTSSNTNVATVDANGKVTAKAAGTTVITVTTDDGKKTASCTVTVSKATISDVTYSTASDKVVNLTDSAFNTVCRNYTGYNLDRVVFDKSSHNLGSLVTGYSNSGDYGPSIGTGTNSPYYTGTDSSKRLSNITFVPDGSKTGDATFGYTGYYYDSTNTLKSYTGKLVITITGPSGDINYKTGKNEPITFYAEDFYDVCSKALDGKLDYVRFSSYNLSKGTLYYKYDDSGEKKVSTSTNYYYSDSPYLDDITFVPDKNATGTTSVRFTAYSTRGKSFTGTVEITISNTGNSSDIVYKVDKNETVSLKNSDFTSYCKDATGSSTIEWIKFTQPSSSKGTLYYKYDTSKQEEVSKKDEYYTNSTPKISDITFVPYKNFTGTVTIDFNGEAGNGKSFTGSFKVKVGASSETGDVNYTAAAGSVVNFNVSDFNTYCKEETGYNLDYIKFSSLPSSSTGTLYYDYSSSSSSNTKVTTSTQYKRSSSSYLDKVTFVPAKSTTGTVEIKFTGKSTGGDSFSGVVSITYTAAKNASPIYYTVGAGALNFKSSDFEAACNSRGAGSLVSVDFSLPSSTAGVLYYNYTSAGNYDSLVMPGVAYGARSGSRLLSYVSFVPAPGFVGTVTLNYTGTDSQNATFKGEVQITVTQANAKPTFTDMGNAQWAAEAVDYLYQRGITTGTSPTTFNPSGKITRGDFILMLYRAFNLSASTTDNFKDVPATSYYAQAIATAKALGIATGAGDGNFNPTANLTREDAMVFIQRTLSRTGKGVADAPASYLDKFPDGKSVSNYAQSAVAALVQAGFIKGDDSGKLNPKGSLTRAEMAVILYRVLTK